MIALILTSYISQYLHRVGSLSNKCHAIIVNHEYHNYDDYCQYKLTFASTGKKHFISCFSLLEISVCSHFWVIAVIGDVASGIEHALFQMAHWCPKCKDNSLLAEQGIRKLLMLNYHAPCKRICVR